MLDCQDYQLLKVNLAQRAADTATRIKTIVYGEVGSGLKPINYKGKWAYEYGLVFKGIEAVYEATGDEKYFEQIEDVFGDYISDDGAIRGYNSDGHNIDYINNGKNIMFLYKKTGKEKYKKALDILRSQLDSQPRTSDGLFWHKDIYPYQVWLDGIYMGDVFYAMYANEFGREQDYDDIINQFVLSARHTMSRETGLLHHAWDEKKEQFWCDPETGLSKHYWGRSVGWYLMAAMDVLDYLPERAKEKILPIFKKVMDGVLGVQDKTSKAWYQILDMGGRKGNYLESSASFMFVYALAKAANKGYFPEYKTAAQEAYKGCIEEFVIEADEGKINLNKVCYVGGLGGDAKRDGSFSYYISETILTNEPKGYGAFILACAEMEKLGVL